MSDNMLWVDVETTGLDPNKDVLLEIGMVYTDKDFKIIDSFCVRRFLSPEEWDIFGDADQFVLDMHHKNGLIKDLLYNTPEANTDENILKGIQQMYQDGGIDKTVVMAGSSLRLDRNFLDRYYPSIAGPPAVSHRTIDVSSEKETLRRYRPEWVAEWENRFTEDDKAHRPLQDIEYSIAEYKFYLGKLGLI